MSNDMLSQIQAGSMLPVLFVEAHFVTGPIYIWTGYGPITWNGQTWSGIGTLLTVSSIEEGADVNARGITLGLSGFKADLLVLALGEVQQGQPVVVNFALFYPGSPRGIIPDPLIAWAGRMDQPTIDVLGTTASISLNCENRLVSMNVAVDRRYTAEDQQRDWPGDLGMSQVEALQDATIYWGRIPSSSNNI